MTKAVKLDSEGLLQALGRLRDDALAELERAGSPDELEAWRIRFFGKKSDLVQLTRGLGHLPSDERPAAGSRLNEVRDGLSAAHAARVEAMERVALDAKLVEEAVDVTLPGRPRRRGRLHPSTRVVREICEIWGHMGFEVFRSRDVETDELNFQLLNFPRHHPARDMQDTFHTTVPDVILRTHTSPGQIHAMRALHPDPVRVVLPGMCYRYEQVTARSEMQFNQIEGLAVGRKIRMSDLKGTLSDFARRLFGPETRSRFRCSYFPFTEPSAEMDIECFLCGGEGCRVCKDTGWLEILGCGMVHPNVLVNGGYDPAEFSGFAFGMGPERIAQLLHGVGDIRQFWANDLRFLEQF